MRTLLPVFIAIITVVIVLFFVNPKPWPEMSTTEKVLVVLILIVGIALFVLMLLPGIA